MDGLWTGVRRPVSRKRPRNLLREAELEREREAGAGRAPLLGHPRSGLAADAERAGAVEAGQLLSERLIASDEAGLAREESAAVEEEASVEEGAEDVRRGRKQARHLGGEGEGGLAGDEG